MFLFKTLKSFAITLPDLRLGYEYEKESEVLYLDKKILKVLNSLSEDSKRELVLYFYCLARFFKAINKINPAIGIDTSGNLSIFEGPLMDLYKEYGTFPDTFNIECIQLKEDVYFADRRFMCM